MKTLENLISEIQFGDLSNSDLNKIAEAVQWRRASLARHNVWTLKKGDKVSFTSGKTGRTLTGPVLEVMRKNVIVDTQHGRYRVPANMLTLETDE